MERIKKIAFFKIHDIWFDTQRFLDSKSSMVSLHTNEDLDKSQYDCRLLAKTFLLDITPNIEAIFGKFAYKSARYAINKAIRDGVTVKKIVTKEEVKQYMKFQGEFCKEKGIPMLHEEELKDLTGYYALSKEGEYLGACAFIESADHKTVRYKYGATLHKLNANEIILWQAIQDYHNQGYQFFDFGGCIPTEDKTAYYYRHYHFKKKFGGELMNSYTYFRLKGIYRFLYSIFEIFVKVFFKGDVNGFTNFLNQKKILK